MPTGLWLTLRLRDVPAMLGWLKAVGFTEFGTQYDDAGVLVHGAYVWPLGGGVMVGADRDSPRWPQSPGTQAGYLVMSDVDAGYGAALAAGGSSLYEPVDEEYGGRSAGVRDPDGNLWSFGTYAPVA